MRRKSKGKQKLEMVKISNESNLQVTFSKRRSGLFKKVSELCILCGAEIVIIVFSPKNKVFSFGHPCVESVVDRFITKNPLQTSRTAQLMKDHRNASVCELNMQLTQVLNELEVEVKRGQELTEMRKASLSQHWWEAPVDELTSSQLAELKVSFEKLKDEVMTQRAQQVTTQSSTALSDFLKSSRTRRIFEFDLNHTSFDPSNMNNMIPSPSAPHQPDDQPLHFPFPPQ